MIKAIASISLTAMISAAAAGYAVAEEYHFHVKNDTSSLITQVLVSEDGETWGYFKLHGGIKAGEDADLEWDQSTNSENCKQHVKVMFEDGSSSKSGFYDFCDNSLVVTVN